ncbi:MAG: alpha/beta hydrolase [Bacteroidetes bacterium]|nr:alpha/beta hydrolase [Bacteroidota bacterium]
MNKIFFQKSGKGKPVVLLHGFCETHEIWENLIPTLSSEFTVYAIDLPGFGNSPLPNVPFSIADIGEMVSAWMRDLKIEKPIAIGHSLGGYVTLAMAAYNKNIFSALGLFHSTAYPDTEEKKANRNKVIEFVQTHGTAPFIDAFVPSLFYRKDHPSIPVLYQIALQTPAPTLMAYAAAMRDRPSYTDILKKFDHALLLVGGRYDSTIPFDALKELKQLAQYPTLKILEETAHAGMYENNLEAAKALVDFCSQQNVLPSRF